ncbi:ACP S-malonyltransferase [Thermodesulfobacteriota bacterium]
MKYKKITLIFPGQGSQYVGMGNEFYENFDFVSEIYDKGSQLLGYDIPDLCFKKHPLGKMMHKADLNKTVYTQPTVLTTSYVCFRVLEETCKKHSITLNASFLAGHSLGEYTALLVSGAMDFETTLDLVNKRAQYITEFSNAYPNARLMAIVNKDNDLDKKSIDSLCKSFQVYVSISNTKKQIVVGGFKKNLTALSKKLKKEGTRGIVLNVEGPFHTPLMQPAAEKLKKELEKIDIKIALKPVIANVSTEAIVDPEHIKKELYRQIFSHVDWRRSIEKIIDNGSDLFIEVGPKTVLSNMVNSINPSVPRLNVEDMKTLEKTIKELSKR